MQRCAFTMKRYGLRSVLLSTLLWVSACSHNIVHSDAVKQHKLLPTDGTSEDLFGFSVAISNDVALIGSLQADDPTAGENAGAAYIYRHINNAWLLEDKLVPSDGSAFDTAGGKVAIFGNTAVVGVSRQDTNGEDAGAVYVFRNMDRRWQQTEKLTADDGRAGDAFGQSIAVQAETLVIGAPRDDVSNGKDAGSVYVYAFNGDRWQPQEKLTAPDGKSGDVFGISVALSGNTLLVGADLHDDPINNAGAVYVFERTNNHWHYQAKLMAREAGDTDIFGVRVALAGNTALISARRDDDSAMGVDSGSAYVFVREQGQWSQQAKLTAPDGAEDDRFARDVALSGDVAVISAMHQDERGSNSGSAYVFTRSGKEWRFHSQLFAEDGDTGDVFGWSVALSKSHALIAAPRNDDQGKDSGSAYIITMNK